MGDYHFREISGCAGNDHSSLSEPDPAQVKDEEKEEKIYDSQVQEKLEEDHKMFGNDQE